MKKLTDEEINKEIEKFKEEVENLKKDLFKKTGFIANLNYSIYKKGSNSQKFGLQGLVNYSMTPFNDGLDGIALKGLNKNKSK